MGAKKGLTWSGWMVGWVVGLLGGLGGLGKVVSESGGSIARASRLPNMSGSSANLYQIRGRPSPVKYFPNWQNFCSKRDNWNEICLFGSIKLISPKICRICKKKIRAIAKPKAKKKTSVSLPLLGFLVRVSFL